jgi:hypothetical protein
MRWAYDWVCDLDIKGFFDNLEHELMMRAVKKHAKEKWAVLYIERWLKAPAQDEAGNLLKRERGTPQGGVISPLLANLFLHYAFDLWMRRKWKHLPFERYADDIIVHCRAKWEAELVRVGISARLKECGLELHPEKTKIVYCKDANRQGSHPNEKFDFLGYTFRPRAAVNRKGQLFCSFSPAISKKAVKKISDEIRSWQLHRRTASSIDDLAKMLNPKLRGWFNYTGDSTLQRSGPSRGMSANRWFAGLVGNTRTCAVTAFKLGDGWFVFSNGSRLFWLSGNDSAARFSPWEPYESRGSRTVLEEPRGEIPRGYLTRTKRSYSRGAGLRTGPLLFMGVDSIKRPARPWRMLLTDSGRRCGRRPQCAGPES